MPTSRKVFAVLAAVGAGVAAAGCGGGASSNGVANESPQQILQSALGALRSARSVHVKGAGTSNGSPISFDATIYANGDIDGTIGQGGQTMQLVKVGSTDYVNANSSFWTASANVPASAAARLSDRWVSIPDSQANLGSQLSIGSLADQISSDTGSLSKGATSTIDGQPAISITSSKQGTLWVATTGTPYPVEGQGLGSGDHGTFTFSAWNQGGSAPSVPSGAVPFTSITGVTGTTGSGPSGATGATGSGLTGGTGATGSGLTGATGTT